MVRALLAGTKTQTRRALKVQPLDVIPFEGDKAGINWVGRMQNDPPRGVVFGCKFGRAGDRLWVRESTAEDCIGSASFARYTADGFTSRLAWWYSKKACPSIHMPRWASRITLEITAIRVERLQDISDEDAVAEGMPIDDAKHDYSLLWDRINGPGSWNANPWVWCVEFRRI
jgi:hypothetical protein